MELPNVNRPCKNCPFRTDAMKGWLGRERMEEILGEDSFVCHKNNDLQCAGHMLIKGYDNAFVRLAGRLGMNTKLSGRELIFKSIGECVSHHSN